MSARYELDRYGFFMPASATTTGVTTLAGTASQIAVSGATGNITASLVASPIVTGSFTAATSGQGLSLHGGGTVTGASGAVTMAGSGTNQNVTLTPSGSGYTILNGNVGIGTTSPSAKLDVAGGIFIENVTGGGIFLDNAGLHHTPATKGHISFGSPTLNEFFDMGFQDGTSFNWNLASGGVRNFNVWNSDAGLVLTVGTDTYASTNKMIINGNVVVGAAGSTVTIKSGSNALAGTVTLVAGAGTITSTAIDANTVIFLTIQTPSGVPSVYSPNIKLGIGSATVTGLATDTSTYNWTALKVA